MASGKFRQSLLHASPLRRQLVQHCGAGDPCRYTSGGDPGVDEPDVSQVIEEKKPTRH
jgi:hypothetical protein